MPSSSKKKTKIKKAKPSHAYVIIDNHGTIWLDCPYLMSWEPLPIFRNEQDALNYLIDLDPDERLSLSVQRVNLVLTDLGLTLEYKKK
jgi:hypothetical protein